jgi:mRNA interferase MazF
MKGLCVIAPVTGQVKRYPFEVLMPVGYGIYGVILADQARTIDWLSRKVSFTRECIDVETINVGVSCGCLASLKIKGMSSVRENVT